MQKRGGIIAVRNDTLNTHMHMISKKIITWVHVLLFFIVIFVPLNQFKIFGQEDFSKERKRLKLEGMQFFEAGNEKYKNKKFLEAIKDYNKALLLFKKANFKTGEADVTYNLGNLYNEQGDYATSILQLKLAQKIYNDLENQKMESDVNSALGSVYTERADYSGALEYFNKSLKYNSDNQNKPGEAVALGNIGNVYFHSGDYKNAKDFYTKSLALEMELENEAGISKSYIQIGNVYFEIGEYELAMKNYNQSISVLKNNKSEVYALAVGNIGRLQYNLGEYPKALESYKLSMDLLKSIDKAVEANTLINLAIIYSEQGKYDKAIELLSKSKNQFQSMGNVVGENNAQINLGNVYFLQGNYEQAFNSLNISVNISKKNNHKLSLLISLITIGEIYHSIGKYNDSLKILSQALDLATDMGVQERIAEINKLQAENYLKVKNFSQAESKMKTASEIYTSIKRKPMQVAINILFTKLYNSQKDIRAIQHIDFADKLESEIQRKPVLAEIALQRAIAQYQKGKLSEALLSIETSISLAAENGFSNTMISALKVKGDINSALNKIPLATENYINALSKLKEMVPLVGEKNKADFIQANFEIYEVAIEFFLRNQKLNEAEKYLNESRGFLTRIQSGEITPGITNKKLDELYKNMIELKRELGSLNEKSLHSKNSKEQEILENKKIKTYSEYQKFLYSIKNFKPGEGLYDKIKLNTSNLNNYKSALSEKGIILEYFFLKENVYVLYVTKSGQGYKLVSNGYKELALTISAYRKWLRSGKKYLRGVGVSEVVPGLSNPKALEEKLYEILIQPIQEVLTGKDRLIIFPFGILYYLPFEVLHKKNEPFLVEKYEINYFAQSGLSKLISNKKVANAKKQVIAFGNPDQTLKWAEEEVKDIGKIFKNESMILTQQEANKEKFKNDSSQYKIIHISTHGVLEKLALDSHLVFGKVKEENPHLRFSEIEAMSLSYPNGFTSTQLIVLSACDTAIEFDEMLELSSAELSSSPTGLASAFEALEIPSIVATLWKVNDESSRKLMVYFYEELKKSDFRLGQSLTMAKRRFIQEAREQNSIETINPYYWSGFVLIGDWR